MVRAALIAWLCWSVLGDAAVAAAEAPRSPDDAAADSESDPKSDPAPKSDPESDPAPESGSAGGFGATATVDAAATPGSVSLPDPETPRRLPGAFGDPYRVAESLPGTVPLASGLPYLYVRGSPPSGNAFYYDDIPLPQLFHLGVGPSILHPMFLGEVTFEPGVSTAQYGRRLGAVITAGPPPPVVDGRGEIEVRLLDANAAVAVPVGEGYVMAAGRFGYPGILAPALGIKLSFSYWDYQLRAVMPLDSDDRVEVIAFGSLDTLDDAEAVGAVIGYADEQQRLELEFHRVEARLIRKRRNFELGTALRLGVDHTVVGDDASADSFTLAPRVWFAGRFGAGHRLQLGADMTGASGRVRELSRAQSLSQEDLRAVARDTLGAYGNLHLNVNRWATLMLGLRGDAWVVGDRVTPSVDPRLRVTLYPSEALTLHAGVGLVHQPVVFAFPLPGFTDIALDRGLQEGIQSELGMGYRFGEHARFETTAFVHRYSGLLLPEIYLRALGDDSQRVDALSYGVEVFLTRPSRHALSGWISYTLGFATATDPLTGDDFAPEFDIRHVVNLVGNARLGGGFSASLALRMRSGRPIKQFTDGGIAPPYDIQLPPFVRLDGRIAYTFATSFGEMEVFLEMLNVTLAREAIDTDCYYGECKVIEAQPIWFPNLGARAGF